MIKLYEKYKETIFITLILSILAHGFWAFNSIFSLDGWQLVLYGKHLNSDYIANGRWVNNLITYLTFDRLFAPGFTVFFFILCLIFSAISFIEHLPIKERVSQLFFCSIFCVFPIWIETFCFKSLHISIGLAVVLCTYSFIYFKRFLVHYVERDIRYTDFGLALLFLFLSVSTYQTYVFYFAIALLIYLYGEHTKATGLTHHNLWKIIKMTTLFVALFTVSYIIGLKVTSSLTNTAIGAEGYYDITKPLHLENLNAQIYGTIRRMVRFLTEPQLLMPPITKITISLSLLISSFFLLKKRKNALIGFALIGCVFIIPWSLGFVRDGFLHYRYNALTPLALSIAYLLIFPIENNYLKGAFSKLYISLLTVCVLVFCFQNSAATYALYLSNQRDIVAAQQFLTQLHNLEDYQSGKTYTIRMYGDPDSYYSAKRPYNTPIYDFSVGLNTMRGSAIMQHRLMPYMIKLISEENFVAGKLIEKSEIQQIITKNNLEKIGVWPEKNAVKILDDGATVVIFFEQIK